MSHERTSVAAALFDGVEQYIIVEHDAREILNLRWLAELDCLEQGEL